MTERSKPITDQHLLSDTTTTTTTTTNTGVRGGAVG